LSLIDVSGFTPTDPFFAEFEFFPVAFFPLIFEPI